MSCILYLKGAYLAIAKTGTFRAAWTAVASEVFLTPECFADALFELNARAYQDRYGSGPQATEILPEIEAARADISDDYEFSEFITAEESEPGEAFTALFTLLGRISYQCSDAHDYETDAVGLLLETAKTWAAGQNVSPRGRERAEEKRRAAEVEHGREVERLKAELRGRCPWAKSRDGKRSEYARAAANLRKELSLTFPGVKFSVTSKSYAGGNSITVSWDFGPTSKEVDAVADKYQDGRFDGMTDSYDYDRSAFGAAVAEVLGRAKYVSTSRSFPSETYEAAQRALCELQHVEYAGPYTRHLLGRGDSGPLEQHARQLLHGTSFPAGVETFAGVEHVPFDEQNGREWARIVFESKPETHTATCGECGREFADESAELAGDMLAAHRVIAHREPEPCGVTLAPDLAARIAERWPDATARVIQFPARAEFRRTPDDEPEPTGTDGGGSVEPGGESAGASEPSAVKAEDPQANSPEFFEWLADEHRAAYAEAFETYEKGVRRGWHRKAETARKAVGGYVSQAA